MSLCASASTKPPCDLFSTLGIRHSHPNCFMGIQRKDPKFHLRCGLNLASRMCSTVRPGGLQLIAMAHAPAMSGSPPSSNRLAKLEALSQFYSEHANAHPTMEEFRAAQNASGYPLRLPYPSSISLNVLTVNHGNLTRSPKLDNRERKQWPIKHRPLIMQQCKHPLHQ